jgi:thymidine kinase
MGLTVIIGPMFSGKSRELILQLERHELAGRKVSLFKAQLPDRPYPNKIITHDKLEKEAIPIEASAEGVKNMIKLISEENPYAVGIDEIQFFPLESKIVDAINYLVKMGKHIYIAGLNLDFRGEPFLILKEILPFVDNIIHLKAVCKYTFPDGRICGREATRTQRLINGKPAAYDSPLFLHRGGQVKYEARCIEHHVVPGAPSLDLKKS